MWQFQLIAPNGLRQTIWLDELQVDSAIEPVEFIALTLRGPLEELFERRGEKNPNMQEAG